MRSLKAKQHKNKYKTEELWLKAVYRNNKNVIDKAMEKINTRGYKGKQISNFKKFKDEVMAYKKYVPKGNLRKAVDALARSEKLTSEKERLRGNAYSALKNVPDDFKRFRELTKDSRGRYTKFEPENLEYVGNNTYFYRNYKNMVNGEPSITVIRFANSPEHTEIMTYEQYNLTAE